MVWSIDAMNRAMAVIPKIRNLREGAGSPGSLGGTGAAGVAGAFAVSLDVTIVYDTAYRQAIIFAWRLVPGALGTADRSSVPALLGAGTDERSGSGGREWLLG
jgi:hypothetical protein